MKKYCYAVIIALICLALAVSAGCVKKNPNADIVQAFESDIPEGMDDVVSEDVTDESVQPMTRPDGELPGVGFTLSREQARPGESVTLSFRLSGVEKFACLSSEIKYDPELLSHVDYERYDEKGFYDIINDEEAGSIKYYGYVATTIDIEDAEMLAVTFEISEDAKPGDIAEISFDISEFMLGVDADGNETYDIFDRFGDFSASIRIV